MIGRCSNGLVGVLLLEDVSLSLGVDRKDVKHKNKTARMVIFFGLPRQVLLPPAFTFN